MKLNLHYYANLYIYITLVLMLSMSPLRHNEHHPRILLSALCHPNVIESKLVILVSFNMVGHTFTR